MFSLLQSSTPDGVPSITWCSSDLLQPDLCSRDQAPPLSFLDTLAAPTVFLQLALVYQGAPLDAVALREAVKGAAAAYPGVCCRLARSEDGRLSLVPSSASGASGAAFLHGTSPHLTLQQLLPPSGPQQAAPDCSTSTSQQLQLPELPDMLFGHLPGALLPDYANSDLPLVHVALLELAGGGSVLGLRMSHLLGDYTSFRLLLRHITAAYTRHQAQQQQQQWQEAALHPAAPLLDRLLSAAWQQQQQQQGEAASGAAYEPLRLKLLQPADRQRFEQLAALATSSDGSGGAGAAGGSSVTQQRPVRLSWHWPAGAAAQLKDNLSSRQREARPPPAAAAASLASSGSAAPAPWCSSHSAVLAAVLAAFGQLPGRALPHDVSVAVDMRVRLPPQQAQLLPAAQQQQLASCFGNFFASAIVEGCVTAQHTRSALAQALQAAVARAAEVWLPDHAWAAGVLGHTAAQQQQQQQQEAGGAATAAAAAEVTWARLHAMGPTAWLQQQMELGLLPSLSTTQWPLDCSTDAVLAGQLPCLAVPSFSQPQPYPLVLTQQGTPAQGGGWVAHVFVDAAEAGAMRDALAAAGEGLQCDAG